MYCFKVLLLVVTILVFSESVESTLQLLNNLHNTVNSVRCDLRGNVLGRRGCGGNGVNQVVQPQNGIYIRPNRPHRGHNRPSRFHGIWSNNQNQIDNQPQNQWNTNNQNGNGNYPNQGQSEQNVQNTWDNNSNQGAQIDQNTWNNDQNGIISKQPSQSQGANGQYNPGGGNNGNLRPQQPNRPNEIQSNNPEKQDKLPYNEERGGFKKDNESTPQPNAQPIHELENIDGLKDMEMVMGPELTLTAYNETKYLDESFFVICTDSTKSGVIWIGPNGIALNDYTRPVVTILPDGALLFFDKVRKEDAGLYSCTRGLRERKYELRVDESPPVLPFDGRRILAVGSNCPKGYYYDKKYCRQSLQ